MKWKDCFEEYEYESFIYKDERGERKLEIAPFLDAGKVPNELREIYISKKRDELFLILQPKIHDDLEKFCSYWDSSILTWINFGIVPGYGHDEVLKLRYNVTMILLYAVKKNAKVGGDLLMECPGSFAIEKSTSVSRKILLACGDDDEIDENSGLKIPFWYAPFKNPKKRPKEDELEKLLPSKEKEPCLLEKREKIDARSKNTVSNQMYFTEDEILAVKGWLEE